MEFAEKYAVPIDGELQASFRRTNEFQESFFIRWGQIRFKVFWGLGVNVKVVIKIHRSDGNCEHFIVDTDPYDIQWNTHNRVTRDFFIHPFPRRQERIKCVKFSYIVHINEQSLPSKLDYIFMWMAY